MRVDDVSRCVSMTWVAMHAGRYLAGAPDAAFDSVAAASSDSRRSKYVVLQDTINMVKMLQERVIEQEHEMLELRRVAAVAVATMGGMAGGGGTGAAAGMGPSISGMPFHQHQLASAGAMSDQGQMAMPQSNQHQHQFGVTSQSNQLGLGVMPTDQFPNGGTWDGGGGGGGDGGLGASANSGNPSGPSVADTVVAAARISVAVDMGEESCYVKVHAPDRRGLLTDILKVEPAG